MGRICTGWRVGAFAIAVCGEDFELVVGVDVEVVDVGGGAVNGLEVPLRCA